MIWWLKDVQTGSDVGAHADLRGIDRMVQAGLPRGWSLARVLLYPPVCSLEVEYLKDGNFVSKSTLIPAYLGL